MIMVDSSVWIDFFRAKTTLQTNFLKRLLGKEDLATGDLVMTEVLQGFTTQRGFEQARVLLEGFSILPIVDGASAIQAARNYRALRDRGITIRKTIDTLIATRCIIDGHTLLYSDRDFDPFVEHLGLLSALPHTDSLEN